MSPRQPFLTASDYAFYLQRQIDKDRSDNIDYDPNNSSFINGAAIGVESELPKLSELLKRLIEDLRYSLISFVDDFINDANQGIAYLLTLLRQSLNRQKCPAMGGSLISEGKLIPDNKRVLKISERQHFIKRAMNDEYDCLLCLKYATNRNPKTLQKVISHRNGLSTLASCIMSNLTKSRLIALEILTKACNEPDGANTVLEAMSTMRIVYGESVRFKFLIGMLNSCNNATVNGFECSALAYLNAILSKINTAAEKIRLQCEFEEAGFDINYVESKLKERGVPFDDPTWAEIKRYRMYFIDVNETLKESKQRIRESDNLKEEVKLLRSALSKLENDKMNFMQIEKELKDKCADLEQEVDLLKSKVSTGKAIQGKGITNKPLQRPGSDNGTGDSGQWSDSDEETRTDSAKTKLRNSHNGLKHSAPENNDRCIDQTMRNEDEELIYIPAIRPPANFAHYVEQEVLINSVKMDNTHTKQSKKPNNREDNDNDRDSRWRQRQRHVSGESKPMIVDVYPKQSMHKEKKSIESVIGTDCENCELTLDWQYPPIHKDNLPETLLKPASEKSASNSPVLSSYKKMSISLNHINEDAREFQSLDSNPQYMLKNRNHFKTFYVNSSTNSSDKPKIPQNEIRRVPSNKSKNFASALQSYFFSGTTSLKKLNRKFGSNSSINNVDPFKSFPLPKSYKNNFILKGHGNCGLYSGEIEDNLPDDIKIIPENTSPVYKDIKSWV